MQPRASIVRVLREPSRKAATSVVLVLGPNASYDDAIESLGRRTDMPQPRTSRYTIGQLMAVIALLAGLLAIPRIVDSSDRLVFFCALGVLTVLCLVAVSLEYLVGKPCPACTRGVLRRLRKHGNHFRCSSCGARLKRFGFGGPWLDASGPEDAARYGQPTGAGAWRGYIAPEQLDDSPSSRLLQRKRSRNLSDEVKRLTPQPAAGRRLEGAEKKIRKFLRSLRGRGAIGMEDDISQGRHDRDVG